MLSLAVVLGLGLGCAGVGGGAAGYDYFAHPEPGDAWSLKIAGWQLRQRAAHGGQSAPPRATVSEPGDHGVARVPADLKSKYESFRSQRKRALAREVAEWIQREARSHYVEDGPADHWATLQETLSAGGDDCDGLELLVYHFLLDLGFRRDEVFRGIVYRRSDGQHHMVTLWFEDPDDPWVIDPTGAMVYGMPRMSEVPDWVPLRVFGEDSDFRVLTGGIATADPRAH